MASAEHHDAGENRDEYDSDLSHIFDLGAQRYAFCRNYTKKPDCICGDSRDSVYEYEFFLLGDFSNDGDDVHKGFVALLLLKFHDAVALGVQGVILAHADVLARIVLRAALTHDDVASDSGLSTEKFHSESFAFRLATVVGTTNAFLVCHISLVFSGFYSVIFSILIWLRY